MLKVDRTRRIIEGRAVPFDTIGYRALGLPLRYPRGSITWSMAWDVRLLIEHNHSLRAGRALKLTELEDGLWGVFKIHNGEWGDKALELADLPRTGMSIGPGEFQSRITPDGIEECVRARIIEVTLTKNPVFK